MATFNEAQLQTIFYFLAKFEHQKRFFIAMDVGGFTIVLYKSCTWHYVQHNKYIVPMKPACNVVQLKI